MNAIWKYHIEPGHTLIKMPYGARLLQVGEDGNQQMCVWALVTPGFVQEIREIQGVGTGMVFDDAPRKRYIGTVVETKGFVWHFFDLGVADAKP